MMILHHSLVQALDATARHQVLATACRSKRVGLHWREWGQGRPLVLLHRGHCSWMRWVRNIEALSRQFRLRVPDMPGFSDSQDFALPAHAPARLPASLQSPGIGGECADGPLAAGAILESAHA